MASNEALRKALEIAKAQAAAAAERAHQRVLAEEAKIAARRAAEREQGGS
jgi:hypothetical protein